MHYLRGRRVPVKLRFEIQDYYTYKFERSVEGARVLDDLPPLLQMKLEVALKKATIERLEIFKGRSSEI